MCRLGLWCYFLGVFFVITIICLLCWWSAELPNESDLDENVRKVLRSYEVTDPNYYGIIYGTILFMCFLTFVVLRIAFSRSQLVTI